MELSIKPIEEKDIETICDWHKEHIKINFPGSLYKRDLFKEKLIADFKVMGKGKKVMLSKYTNDNQMVGFLWLKIIFDPYKDCEFCDLHYIHIALTHRRQGIGKRLMRLADSWVKKNGVKEVRLGTHINNSRAIGLYKKCGYKIKRVLMEKNYD